MWKKLGRTPSNGSNVAAGSNNEGSAKRPDTSDGDLESGLHTGGHSSQIDSNDTIRTNPDIGPSTQTAAPQPPGGWIKKNGITGTLKRMLSGKSKRKSGLPMTVQEVDADAAAHAPPSDPAHPAHASPPGPKSSAAKEWDEKRRRERKKEAKDSEARAKDNGPSPIEVLQMVKYLGIEAEDKDFYWVAEEALRAELPQPWEEHATEDAAVYFFNPITKESSWEHPLDGYYRFLYRKMKKMKRFNRAGVPKKEAEAGGSQQKDRELVDLLWAMQQEQKKTDVMESSETSSFYESSSRAGDSSSGRSSANSASGSSSSISATSGAIMLDPHNLPDEVREIAQYLGINLDTLGSPVTVQEVEEMAEYLGIQVQHEGYLLPLAKLALQAPLPKGWEIYKDDKGEPFYFQRSTGRTSYRHPADEYFINKVMEDRARHVKALQEGSLVKLSEPWLDFVDEQGRTFWYNFKTRQRSLNEPPRLSVLDEGAGGGGSRGTSANGTNGANGANGERQYGGVVTANGARVTVSGRNSRAHGQSPAAAAVPMLGKPAAASLREELSH